MPVKWRLWRDSLAWVRAGMRPKGRLSIFNDVQKERGLCPLRQMYTAVNREAPILRLVQRNDPLRMLPSGVKTFFLLIVPLN